MNMVKKVVGNPLSLFAICLAGGSICYAGTSCWITLEPQQLCCAAPQIVCRKQIDEVWHYWSCSGSVTGLGPVYVNTVTPVNPPNGQEDFTSTQVRTCTITPVTCGGTVGACVTGTPIPTICVSTVASGPACK
jgi:hypothetical protein